MSAPYDRTNPAAAIPVYTVGAPGGMAGAPLGFQTENITNAAAVQLPAPPTGAIYAVVSSPVSFLWRDDAVAPTATVGIAQPANTPLQVSQSQFAGFRALSTTAGPNAFNVSYYGMQGTEP